MLDIALYISELHAHQNPEKAAQMRAYHKVDRPYLGLANAQTGELAMAWRHALPLGERIALAQGLWDSNIFEARVAAAKMFTQARIKPDDDVWAMIRGWAADFDSWAIADHACIAGQKRLIADPARIADIAGWPGSDHMWTRRAALVLTLPWAKMNTPKPADLEIRAQVLDWAASLVPDRNWFIQKAIAWWLRDLSKRDPDTVRSFLQAHGQAMKPFAVKEASKYLPPKAD